VAKNEELFEESSQGAVSAVTALSLVLSLVLTLGGFFVMGLGFDAGIDEAMGLTLFAAGLGSTLLGFFIPFTLLGATGK